MLYRMTSISTTPSKPTHTRKSSLFSHIWARAVKLRREANMSCRDKLACFPSEFSLLVQAKARKSWNASSRKELEKFTLKASTRSSCSARSQHIPAKVFLSASELTLREFSAVG